MKSLQKKPRDIFAKDRQNHFYAHRTRLKDKWKEEKIENGNTEWYIMWLKVMHNI